MPNRKPRYLIWAGLGILLLAGLLFLLPVSRASAQCGSQASSCKNCHETQGKKPVNNDGTGWHTGHAFGDFCYACHGGNNQSMDEAQAHTGMVPPLSDIQIACAGCHPNDLQERAQKYATILGVDLNAAAPPAAQSTPSGGAAGSTSGGDTSGGASGGNTTAPSGSALVVPASSDVIDYNQQYAQTVEGKLAINWGNVIVGLMILMVAGGGGAFVYFNERKLRGLPMMKAASKPAAPDNTAPVVEGYSTEVTALLPLIARLNPTGLYALRRLLQNPEDANELLHSLSRMDPELVKKIRSLDRDSRALLLALAGE